MKLPNLFLRLRFTALFLTIMVVANTATGNIFGSLTQYHLRFWGISLEALTNLEIYRLITAIFLSHDQGMFVRQFIFGGLVLGVHEWLTGFKDTVLTYFFVDIVGTLLFFAGLAVFLSSAFEDVYSTHDVGMSAGGFAVFGSLIAMLPRRSKYAAATAVVAVLSAKLVWKPDIIADGIHLVCFPMGFLSREYVLKRS